MEPEGSLPYSQESTSCPYPDPDQSSPCPPSHLILNPPTYAWLFQVVAFPQVSPLKPCIYLSSPPYVLNAPPISFFLIWSPE